MKITLEVENMTPATKTLAVVAFATATSISASANATIYTIDYHDAGVWQAYDKGNETYSMKFRSDQGKDGFWLVVTDGDNPKGGGSTNAILYGDLVNNKITAYTYSGENNANSYQAGTLLGTYDNAFSSGGKHSQFGYDMTMFSLDVEGLNNALGPDFDGVTLGENAGIWFHQSAGSDFTYGTDGSITDYAFNSQMWLDRGNDPTSAKAMVNCAAGETAAGQINPEFGFINSCDATQLTGVTVGSSSGGTTSGGGSVPAPGGLALILVGLAGLGRKFRSTRA